mmetsp:Transcript_3627/g.10192  ORF Transcript_3627/g.10192 Transcript_3627/m.10192 type:complete len:217 (-) Transcript_3627:36-686(-)
MVVVGQAVGVAAGTARAALPCQENPAVAAAPQNPAAYSDAAASTAAAFALAAASELFPGLACAAAALAAACASAGAAAAVAAVGPVMASPYSADLAALAFVACQAPSQLERLAELCLPAVGPSPPVQIQMHLHHSQPAYLAAVPDEVEAVASALQVVETKAVAAWTVHQAAGRPTGTGMAGHSQPCYAAVRRLGSLSRSVRLRRHYVTQSHHADVT